MPGNCSVYRSWVTGDSLSASDLTTSFTTIGVTNMTPSCMDDYSLDATQMQATTDPYPAGVISQATSLAGELERIRYVIKNVLGFTQWYTHSENINFGAKTLTFTKLAAIDAKGDILAGTAADTFSRLAVGTNGQFLKADSAQATGLAWATATDAGAVQLATATTKGDIYAATAASTVTRLGVGANGTVLTAASGQATGLQWATPVAAATQAEMETASITTAYASPGRVKNHPGVAKAWVHFFTTGSIQGGYNVGSVDDDGVGDWGINFTTAFSAATYAANLEWLGTINDLRLLIKGFDALNTTSAEVRVVQQSDGAASETGVNSMMATFFGDHA
jgi:hypothetical protein